MLSISGITFDEIYINIKSHIQKDMVVYVVKACKTGLISFQ